MSALGRRELRASNTLLDAVIVPRLAVSPQQTPYDVAACATEQSLAESQSFALSLCGEGD